MAYYGSDYSDGFSDDGDFIDYQERIKSSINGDVELSPEEQEKKDEEAAKQALFNGLCYGNLDTVKEGLDKGIDINVDLQAGWTPILLACAYGHLNIAKELINRGADVNSHIDNFTALMMACNCPSYTSTYENSVEIIKLLIEKGASPKKVDRKRMNALMYASGNGNLDAVKLLYPLSENEAIDNQGWSAIFWAINSNHIKIVEYLLEQGADINKADVRGETPLDLAKLNDFEDITKLFIDEKEDEFNLFDVQNYGNIIVEEDIKNPRFFLNVYHILFALKSENVIKHFYEKNITLSELLSSNDEDLKKLGIEFQYQRKKILNGLHRFHNHIYQPKSVLYVKPKDIYTNIDSAIQIVACIKQFIAMESSLNYILKNSPDLGSKRQIFQNRILKMKNEIKSYQIVAKTILTKSKMWDKYIQADLITKNSSYYIFPYRKLVCFITFGSLILYRYFLRPKLT